MKAGDVITYFHARIRTGIIDHVAGGHVRVKGHNCAISHRRILAVNGQRRA